MKTLTFEQVKQAERIAYWEPGTTMLRYDPASGAVFEMHRSHDRDDVGSYAGGGVVHQGERPADGWYHSPPEPPCDCEFCRE